MKNGCSIIASLTAILLFLCCPAKGDIIVDTGDAGFPGFGWAVDLEYRQAAEVVLSQSFIITGIEGWMNRATAGDLTVSIYDDGGDAPGATELYSVTFFAEGLDGGLPSWIGTPPTSWHVGPGAYWIAFEVRSGDGRFALQTPATNPLDNYAFGDGSGWTDDFSIGNGDWGIRVHGDPVVPEPTTAYLFGMALIVIVGKSRRRLN